ncbi:MAG: mechanosensitive ion channel [Xanthomonadales bacterium]|nr:mechanosensitive ion channel [Xanthomonadales bacterium]
MKILTKIMLALLVSLCLPVSTFAQGASSEEKQDIKSMINTLTTDMKKLEFLNAQMIDQDSLDYSVLLYRQDERSFNLLTDFDTLVSSLAELPESSETRSEAESMLAEVAKGVGDAIFIRINEIGQRIKSSKIKLAGLSGGTLVAAEAYINSLGSIRVKYYESLVGHIQSQKTLGLSSDQLLEQLTPQLSLYAETLTGRIELLDVTISEVHKRQELDPENTDNIAALTELETRHKTNVQRLEAIIMVLDSLGLNSAEYKAVMLQQSSNLSVSYFSPKAVVSVIKDGWRSLRSAFEENAPDIFFRLLLFFGMLLIFRILSRITRRLVRAASDRSSLDMSVLLKNILVSTSGGLVMGLGVLMALSQVGISLGPMLAGLGVAGFIIGFALQDTLGNFAAGAMILIYRPFDVDDFVEVTGASGLVRKMNLVSTTITTFDNQTLVVPNSKIWGDVIKNVTAQTERRIDLEFGIGYDDDIELAERVLHDIVCSHEKVLKQPEPMIHLHTLGDSSVNFIVRPWTKTADYWDVYWDIMREVKLRFDREGISIPYPQRDVHLYTDKDE